ncbi:MAG: trigger factor family protein, partial [Muribaculaceae bacterium]|nr:trigger factor family protein [Muribaculaceae bacterium]
VLGEPLPVESKEITLDQKEYTFEYEIGLAPEISLVLDKNVHLPYYEIEVTDEMIGQQDEAMRKRFGKRENSEEVDDTAIVKGVIMELNEDGAIKEGEDAIQVTNGMIVVFQIADAEQRALFTGKKINDKVRFNAAKLCGGNLPELASMLNIERERAAEVTSDFEMAISEIMIVKLAEHNQEFFDEVFGRDKIHTEDEYKDAVKGMIAADLMQYSDYKFRDDAEKKLLADYGNFELPKEFLKKWLLARNPEATAEQIDADFDNILSSLRWQLIKEHVAQQTGLKIEEEDLKGFARALAQRQLAQYGITNMDDETVNGMAERILNDKQYHSRIVEQVGDMKLYNAIKEAVALDTNNVSLEAFQEMMKPQTEAAE